MTTPIPRAVLVDLIEQFEAEAARLDEAADDIAGRMPTSLMVIKFGERSTGIRTVTTGLRAMLNLDRADKARKEG